MAVPVRPEHVVGELLGILLPVIGLAAACDFRIADETARFAVPAGRLGLAYPADAVADLVSALYQMLEPPAWADELCTPPAVPITTPAPDMFTECMQRPHIHAWPKTAIGDAEVGTLFVGTPPLRADALPPKRPRDEFECHMIVPSEL